MVNYADVYRHFGLMHERSYFAHCIHCSGEERAVMLDTKVKEILENGVPGD